MLLERRSKNSLVWKHGCDRVLATRFGVKAVDMLVNKESGKMACLKGTEIGSVDLKEATSSSKTINPDLYKVAELFFG